MALNVPPANVSGRRLESENNDLKMGRHGECEGESKVF